MKLKEEQIRDLEGKCQELRKYKENEKDTEVLMSALSAMQEKTQHLENSLSAETRIKLDLFSALGDAKRQLEIAQGQIHQREQEIAELKQKIAEVMAVMPSLSYSSDGSNLSPVTPHYSSKFMDNSPSSLDPNASVYQPLKKWLWHHHFCQTELFLFGYFALSSGLFFVFLSLLAPDCFFAL